MSLKGFRRLGLSSTLIHYENGAFGKLSSNRRNLKKLALRFSVDEMNLMRFQCKTSVFKFLRPSVDWAFDGDGL